MVPKIIQAQPMHSEQAIRSFYDAFSASEFDAMEAMLHPDCILEFPGSSFGGQIAGRTAIMELFRGVQTGFGGSLRFHHRFAMHQPHADAGDMIAEHWYTTGRTITGGAYMNRGVAWFRLEDGFVREFLDFFDTQIVDAFFPGGRPAENFEQGNVLVDRLRPFAPADALKRLDALRAAN